MYGSAAGQVIDCTPNQNNPDDQAQEEKADTRPTASERRK